VQEVVEEAFSLFAPLLRRDWLSWGGELLFSDLREQVEREEREEKEARLREAEESERVARREVEEEAKCVAAEAKAARLEARRVALGEVRKLVLAEFWAKTLLKDDLLRQNAELAAEASAIEKEEAGDGDEVEVIKETVGLWEGSQVAVGKWKADEMEGDDDGEDEVNAKRSKGVANGLLEFMGSVSNLYRIYWDRDTLNDGVVVQSLRWLQVSAGLHREGGGR
jgi:hypothetical protein